MDDYPETKSGYRKWVAELNDVEFQELWDWYGPNGLLPDPRAIEALSDEFMVRQTNGWEPSKR